MKILLSILTPILLLAGCSPDQPSYYETLEKWQAERDDTAYQELLTRYNQADAELANVKAKVVQVENVNKQISADNKALSQKVFELEGQLSQRPATDDILRISGAMQEQAWQFDDLSNRFIALMSMYQELKIGYKALGASFREAISTGNFTDNQTRDYLELIKNPQ